MSSVSRGAREQDDWFSKLVSQLLGGKSTARLCNCTYPWQHVCSALAQSVIVKASAFIMALQIPHSTLGPSVKQLLQGMSPRMAYNHSSMLARTLSPRWPAIFWVKLFCKLSALQAASIRGQLRFAKPSQPCFALANAEFAVAHHRRCPGTRNIPMTGCSSPRKSVQMPDTRRHARTPAHVRRRPRKHCEAWEEVMGTDCFLPFGFCGLSLKAPKDWLWLPF